MNKYTDGYYIYDHVDFTCHIDLRQCDGCNRTLTGFVYVLMIENIFEDHVIYCADCMSQLQLISVS
ncbi:hypothetical protein [Acinetobacter shaoyimingii]|uniref:Uncharacterized protein n=1 Tax=Acinetobacter shaoyimingii TaxID=2715164 RepID=A0A6G8RYL4_9GAMM|nr:hypothetical protein [Acinetobacter shaoyimingii]NHB57994.1 hypothetical protein [Acinetobacter shaoyimingii]QIO06955.1 hypothetical protein G8E00_13905 [Acinetobacter shaoyimingii]